MHDQSHSRRGSSASRWWWFWQSPSFPYWVYCAFVCLVFVTGGGSRGDIQALIVLRPASLLFVGLALIMMPKPSVRIGLPLWLLLGLAVVMLVQLLPLPHSVWTSLPGRELVAAHDSALGLGDLWRSATFSPNRTINSLFALGVPLATFLLIKMQGSVEPRRILWPILAAGGVSALLGLLQILGPSGGALYFYAISNADAPVGLFSNRNHQAIFLVSLLPLIAYTAVSTPARRQARALIIVACAGGAMFLIPLILATGSRAGALLAIAAVFAAGVLVAVETFLRGATNGGQAGRFGRWVLAGLGAALAGTLALAYIASRSLAFERLFNEQLDNELRVRLLPHLWDLVWRYFPTGTGFGTFELTYKISEPDDFLDVQYLNQAHNDLVQLLIEGGLAGAVLLAIFMLWFGYRGLQAAIAVRRGPAIKGQVEMGPYAWIALAVILAGSLGDYPLRTPSMMLCTAVLCALLGKAWRRAPAAPRRGSS